MQNESFATDGIHHINCTRTCRHYCMLQTQPSLNITRKQAKTSQSPSTVSFSAAYWKLYAPCILTTRTHTFTHAGTNTHTTVNVLLVGPWLLKALETNTRDRCKERTATRHKSKQQFSCNSPSMSSAFTLADECDHKCALSEAGPIPYSFQRQSRIPKLKKLPASFPTIKLNRKI